MTDTYPTDRYSRRPWTPCLGLDDYRLDIVNCDGVLVAQVLTGTSIEPTRREIDITRLLANAPELCDTLVAIASDLEACTCAKRSWYGADHDGECPVGRARAALASLPPLRPHGAPLPLDSGEILTAEPSCLGELLTLVDAAYPDGFVRRCAHTDTADGDALALYIAREVRDVSAIEPDLSEAVSSLASALQTAIDEISGVISALIATSNRARALPAAAEPDTLPSP